MLTAHFVSFLIMVLTIPLAIAEEQDVIGDAASTLPLFDAHMLWKQPAWKPYPPEVVISLMDKNGVAMALVSSSPDTGTITLWEYAPDRIIPEMRPYNDKLGPTSWMKAEGVGDYIEERVKQYSHRGIGEFHLHRVDPDDEALMKRIVALAGMSEPANAVKRMMVKYSKLYADTSYREWDILNGDNAIDPDWRRVLERFSGRFMVGSDTWINSQWENYDHLIETNRKWLAHLKTDTARKIAYQNAERLFGRTIARGPTQ